MSVQWRLQSVAGQVRLDAGLNKSEACYRHNIRVKVGAGR